MNPKPPPGFELVGQGTPPPPPPGFEYESPETFSFGLQLNEQPQSFAQQFESLMQGNGTETAPNIYSGEFEGKTAPTTYGRFKAALSTMPETFFGNDQELATKTAAQTPGAQATQDDNGNPMVQMPDGSRYYVNQPGADKHDVLRMGAQIAPYLPGAQLASMPAKLGTRMMAQGAVAGATNAAGQSTIRDEIDPTEVGTTAALGAGSELLGPILGKAANSVKRLLGMNKTPVEIGKQFAQDLGYADVLPVAKYAEIGDKLRAGVDPKAIVGELQYGIKYTRGQMTADPKQLAMEEPLYQISDSMKGLVADNQAAVKNQIDNFPTRFSGDNAPVSPVNAMERVQNTVQQQAKAAKGEYQAAYAEAGDKAAFDSATVRDLGKTIKNDLQAGKVSVHPVGTPKAYESLRMLEDEISKIPGDAVGIKVNAAERMGRLLSGKVGEASRSGNKTDLRAAQAVKKSYDTWFNQVTDSALVKGDKNAIDALRRGRSTFADFSKRFTGDGSDKAMDGIIQRMVSGKDSGQELINSALGMSQMSKPAAYKFVNRVKMATKNDPQVINDMRSAHVMQLFMDKAGNPLSYGEIVRNIRTTKRQNPEIVKALYGNEWSKIEQFGSVLEPLLAKGDMKRTSGTAERLLRYLTQMAESTPFLGTPVKVLRGVRGENAGQDALRAPVYKPPLQKTNRVLSAGVSSQGSSPSQ